MRKRATDEELKVRGVWEMADIFPPCAPAEGLDELSAGFITADTMRLGATKCAGSEKKAEDGLRGFPHTLDRET